MEDGLKSMGERGDRRRWREHLDIDAPGTLDRRFPTVEGEHPHVIGEYQVRCPVRAYKDRSDRQEVDRYSPDPSILGPVDAPSATEALRSQASIELRRGDRPLGRPGDSIPIGDIGTPPA